MTPTPVVVTNMPSAAPLGTTLVSPVTICTPALAAAAAMSATISFSSAMGKPSSSTNAAEIQDGTAPDIAKSLQVPWMASSPMEPPGKRLGCTTNESVDIAIRSPLGKETTAPSPSASSVGLRNASTNTASTSAAEDFPPAPCARVTCSSSNRGRRLRNNSIRWITSPSANCGPEERYSPAGLLTRPPDLIAGTFVGRQPQLIAQQRLRFLNPVHTLRTNNEAGVHIWVGRK